MPSDLRFDFKMLSGVTTCCAQIHHKYYQDMLFTKT